MSEFLTFKDYVFAADYWPYGEKMAEYNAGGNTGQRYIFTEKERDVESGYDYFGARYYDSDIGRWLSVDPLSHERPMLTPYNYCQNTPLVLVDPDGMLDDWVVDKDGQIYWDENATSQETTKEGETYLGKTVVVFRGNESEQLGKGGNMLTEGAVLAEVTIYGAGGSEDITTYQGYTMSSDPTKFGVVADGMYTVNRLGTNERKGPYGSEFVLESRTTKIPARGNFNPAHPERNPGYLDHVFIHRSNNDGWAGVKRKKNGRTVAVSEGCLLINPKQWSSFEKKLSGINSFKLIIKR